MAKGRKLTQQQKDFAKAQELKTKVIKGGWDKGILTFQGVQKQVNELKQYDYAPQKRQGYKLAPGGGYIPIPDGKFYWDEAGNWDKESLKKLLETMPKGKLDGTFTVEKTLSPIEQWCQKWMEHA